LTAARVKKEGKKNNTRVIQIRDEVMTILFKIKPHFLKKAT
jgi:hypothetical protein